MNARLASILAASMLALLPAAGSAEVIRIPLGAQGSPALAAQCPERGISMDAVKAGWGEPVAQQAAVGEPPISRWDYADFFVYFEYTHVLHCVLRHRPAVPPSPQPSP